LCLIVVGISFAVRPAVAQDWIHIQTGLGVEKPRVAVADFAARADSAKSHSALFTQVVRDDLGFSGILEVSARAFAELAAQHTSELRYVSWTDSPVNAHFVAFGNLVETSGEVAIQAWFYDVTNRLRRRSLPKSIAARRPTRKCANSHTSSLTKSSCGFPAGCPASLPPRSLS